jgi:hypothetical protein
MDSMTQVPDAFQLIGMILGLIWAIASEVVANITEVAGKLSPESLFVVKVLLVIVVLERFLLS